MHYNFKDIEKIYQNRWDFSSNDNGNKCYILEMFPYPSGNIHMGHVRNYTIGDVIARYKRACGFNVLHPIGWDAFGLPAENAAIENKINPKTWTKHNIDNMRTQLKSLGLSYNWGRELSTCDPEYYKHEQKFFLDFLKHGIAYRKESWVNWDPVDQTVLANEQVIDGKGWRSGAAVEKRKLSQWFLKITDFADDLIQCLGNLKNWPDKVKTMQEHWIGKSEGVTIEFKIVNSEKKLKVFTTCPHTLFGASFCAVSLAHPIVQDMNLNVDAIKMNEESGNEKIGIYTSLNVQHPFLDKELPIYAANFILMEYGEGAIFGCPAHDQRDLEFAQKYNLPIIQVISSNEEYMCNSEFLDGLTIQEAKNVVLKKLEEQGIGKKTVHYRLHDWGISRQRYWGCPIPIIYCNKCGIVSVPEEDLPVVLPIDVNFSSGGNPLDKHPTWKFVNCPQCGQSATRETDTFDTFFESSWYFIAFCSKNKSLDKSACDKFIPIDYYIGGVEHAILHLLYSRFFCRALTRCGYFDIKEPFSTLITQGMVCHVTYKDQNEKWLFPEEAKKLMAQGIMVEVGKIEKMSKSKKNVIDPSIVIDKYGVDTLRLFILSDNPPEKDMVWSDDGVKGCARYINRLLRVIIEHKPIAVNNGVAGNNQHREKIHKLLHHLTNDIENFRINCAVAKFREMTNIITEMIDKSVIDEAIFILLRVIEPFMPHLAEYLWQEVGGNGMLYLQPWPKADLALISDSTVTVAIQINGKLRSTINVAVDLPIEELKKTAVDAVAKKISNSKIHAVHAVPNRIVNIIIID